MEGQVIQRPDSSVQMLVQRTSKIQKNQRETAPSKGGFQKTFSITGEGSDCQGISQGCYDSSPGIRYIDTAGIQPLSDQPSRGTACYPVKNQSPWPGRKTVVILQFPECCSQSAIDQILVGAIPAPFRPRAVEIPLPEGSIRFTVGCPEKLLLQIVPLALRNDGIQNIPPSTDRS